MIEFDVFEHCQIIGIHLGGLQIYTAKKKLIFSYFLHVTAVRNICRCRDLSNDVCTFSFRSQLLPFQVRILHNILQHLVTPMQGYSNEVTGLDIRLLNFFIQRRPINLRYTIMRHMLGTPVVTNQFLPYNSIIIKILWDFDVSLTELVYGETKKLGREIIAAI